MAFAAPLLAMALAAGVAEGGGGVPVRLHVGVDLGAQFLKVALELTQGSCSTAADASGCVRGEMCESVDAQAFSPYPAG